MSSRRSASLAAVIGLVLAGLVLPTLSVAAAAPAPEVIGAACQPDQGVTVAVDFLLDPKDNPDQKPGVIKLGCAIGAQGTMATAAKAAGFDLDPTTGFLCKIDGVVAEPAGCTVYPGAYWSIYTSTTNGKPTGPAATEWTFANVGIEAGPAPAGSALLFQIQPYADNLTPRIPLTALPTYRGDGSQPPPAYPATSNPDALAAAGWLGRQLATHDGVFVSAFDSTFVDWGLTEDALLALAGAGVGKTQIEQTAARIYASGDGYIGAPSDAKDSWKYVAKTALALQVAGLDPTAFPSGGKTRNLLAELRAVQNADGSFGADDVPFIHALALYTLSRTDGGVPTASVSWLKSQQCRTKGDANFGAYGYQGCDGVDVDGTALAVQALTAAGVGASDPAVADARSWIVGQQDKTGGLPSSFGGLNTNSTSLAAQTLRGLGATGRADAAAAFISGFQISCATIGQHKPLAADTVGAIAYDADGRQNGLDFGIDDTNRDQWTRATAQAILALGAPTFDKLSAADAQSALPAPATCAPPTTTPATPTTTRTTPTSGPPATPSTSRSPISTAPTSTRATATSGTTISTIVSTTGISSGEPATSRTPATSVAAGPTITLSDGAVAPGDAISVTVTGAPAGASLPVTLRSSPVRLGNLDIAADGAGTGRFIIPSDTPDGVHHVIVTVAGVELSAQLLVRPELAATGARSTTGPMTFVGLLLLLVGGAILLLARRPRIALGRHRR